MKVIRTGYKSRAIRALAWSHINVPRSSFGYVTKSHVPSIKGDGTGVAVTGSYAITHDCPLGGDDENQE